jgi:hypothetical protein
MTSLCNTNYQSQYCFINGDPIHINEYIQNNNKEKLFCQKGHELTLANGSIIIPYFRHKNTQDIEGNPMTKWHCEWQGCFPITEQTFIKKETQIKKRRADVVLNKTTILEIQHSKCEREEIDNRKHDYKLHGVEIIWLIDGSNNINIKVKEIETKNRLYLEFTSECWKYENFKSYDFIFIDIHSTIYKIYPNKVKSHMIDVDIGKTKEEFINSLKNGTDIWCNDEPLQCNLFIRQQGAGNGKTFGIIRMLEDDDNLHYKNFIYITKQHSAKHIIKTEFENQKDSFKYFRDINIIPDGKKYIIKYFNEKSQQNCQIIISTIDSFTYSIGNKNHNYYDKFEGLIYSIMNGYIETKSCGTIQFARINPKLNKETLLVIDEFQDPPEHYAKAIIQIMINKYIDVFIVGDKLQSISNEKNAFIYFLENTFPLINTILLEPSNICRRFNHPTLVKFVNFMIPFEKYNLPSIIPYKEYDGNDIDPLKCFVGNPIHLEKDNEKKEDIIIEEVEKIMKHYISEVEENKRYPEDFLIVTPFTKINPLVDALLLAINIYWNNKFTDDSEYMINWSEDRNINNYYRYAIFHKSEEGTSIDLTESEYSTRIVSCHSSKGDGRNVVFLIGFNEPALKKYSQTSNNLIYDSMLHVAITRMKERLYIRYEHNNDDISQKINKYIGLDKISKEKTPNINKITNFINYKNDISINNNYEWFNENIISKSMLEKPIENTEEKRIIDMGNHLVRFSSLFINILLECVKKERNNKDSDIKKQFAAMLYDVSEISIVKAENLKQYYLFLENDDLPIICISNKGNDYIRYFNIIFKTCKHLQIIVKKFLKTNTEIKLCPLECIILYYILDITRNKKYSLINIIDIYDLMDVYNNCFDNNEGHDNCLCKKHFNKYPTIKVKNKKVDAMKSYLMCHFDKINDIKHTMFLFHKKYPKINWLYSHTELSNFSESFIISAKFNLIGYDNENVIICYVKPQFNLLNFNEILMNSMFDTHLISNLKDTKSNNYKRFYGKKVITCVLTLDNIEPFFIEWNDMNGINLIKQNIEKFTNVIYLSVMEKYKRETNSLYYFYIYWREYCPENERKPISFIYFLKQKLEIFKNENFPKYIDDFFTQIENEIEFTKGKTNKENILKKYDEKQEFTKQLERKLDNSVKRWLEIPIDGDSDSDEE